MMTISRVIFSQKLLGGFTLFFLVLAFAIPVNASDLTSTSFKIHDPIVGTGGGYGTSANFKLISAGNILGSMGGASSASFKANYGFLYYSDATTPTISFDIDASVAGGTSAAPYLVHLGTLSTGTVKHSDASAVEMIVINGSTNSASGMTVTVQNANGASGLKSSAVPADNIPSAIATMAAGTANYGICIDSGGSLTGFTAQGIYTASPCTTASSTNHVATITTSPVTIVSASAPITNAKAEVFVNATISASTKAHTDYGDTLTFIATSSF